MGFRNLAILSALVLLSAFILLPGFALADVTMPVSNTTITIGDTGAMHFKVVQTVANNKEGTTGFHFELQKIYSPENLSVYDAGTGKPLKFTTKELSTAWAYDAIFDRPYYTGYTFVIEYDNHNRIIDEGSGVYTMGMRSGVNTQLVDWTYTVIFPPTNFTYLGYKDTLEKPRLVDVTDGRIRLYFHNVSVPPAEFAFEIRFRAIGIKDELRRPDPGTQIPPIPGMEIGTAATALIAAAGLRYRRKN